MPPAAVGAISLVSGLVQGIGQARAGSLAAEAGDIAQRQAEENAAILEELGEIEATDIRRTTGRLLAAQRAAYANAGVVVGTGSALDVELDAAVEGEVEALNAKFGLDSRAYRQRVIGIQAEFAGEAAQAAAKSQAIGTILSGVAGAANFADQAGLFRGTGKSVTVPKTTSLNSQLPALGSSVFSTISAGRGRGVAP